MIRRPPRSTPFPTRRSSDLRHTVLDETNASAGHAALDPVQFSATSHTPPDDRHTVADDTNEFAGQLALDPMQFSADRKSTRLNSSHSQISYAVFCLKKNKKH